MFSPTGPASQYCATCAVLVRRRKDRSSYRSRVKADPDLNRRRYLNRIEIEPVRTVIVHMRNAAEYDAVVKRARQQGVSLSSFVRIVLGLDMDNDQES